jgi:hypothetical protein
MWSTTSRICSDFATKAERPLGKLNSDTASDPRVTTTQGSAIYMTFHILEV